MSAIKEDEYVITGLCRRKKKQVLIYFSTLPEPIKLNYTNCLVAENKKQR